MTGHNLEITVTLSCVNSFRILLLTAGMGLSVYITHGGIRACYLCPTWIHYGRAHMGLPVWVLYGQARIHHTGGPYGLAI